MDKKAAVVPVLALFALGALGACTTAPGGAGATPTPTTTAAAACPVGSWRSTSVASNTAVAGTTVTLQGGADVSTTIAADGTVITDFSAMKPVTYSTAIAGAQVSGELLYQGPLAGKVDLASPSTSTSSGATSSGTTSSGTTTSSSTTPATSSTTSSSASASASSSAGGTTSAWRPVGPVNFGDLTVTVKLTRPVALTIVNNVKLSDVTNNQTTQAGNVVDLQPLLRTGTYRCGSDDTLVITPSGTGGPTVVWTFARATAAS